MNIVYENKLSNGFFLTCEDCSKRIAGDRWLVRIKCLAALPLLPWMADQLAEETEENQFVLDNLDGKLEYVVVYDRNFIGQSEKGQVVDELLERVNSMISYIEKDDFPTKFFQKKINEFKVKFNTQPKLADENVFEEESGKADFSACFK